MKNKLIEKVIKSNNVQCPEFVFSNPLLDRNVASALSKSYIKILRLSNQNTNVNNNNLRLSVLTNIRKMCKIEPENHMQINEKLTCYISDSYSEHTKQKRFDDINQTLDAYLIKKLKDIQPKYQSTINPEIIQALNNLNENNTPKNLSNVIHWQITNKHLKILQDLWHNNSFDTENITNDISVIIKSDIEVMLLDICYSILINREIEIANFLSRDNLEKLVKKCSISPLCFQICYSINNYLLIKTNFDVRMRKFVQMFVKNVKLQCIQREFSVLYSHQLSHIVLLLDFNVNELQDDLKNKYINRVLDCLHHLAQESENDFILLLSHFPEWFDIYFKNHT